MASNPQKLKQTMTNISQKAQERGLTPEILEDILTEEILEDDFLGQMIDLEDDTEILSKSQALEYYFTLKQNSAGN